MPKIIISDGGRHREVELAGRLVIGRDPKADPRRRPHRREACEACARLSGLDVSPRHAEIRKVPAGYEIVDLQSRHGTFVDGRKVTRAPLRDGARIEIGGREILFRETPAGDAPPAGQATRLKPAKRPTGPLCVVASRDSLDPLLFVGPSAFREQAEVERFRERLRALREVGQRIATIHNSDALFQQVLAVLAAALPQAQRGFIALLDPLKGALEVKKSFTAAVVVSEGMEFNVDIAGHVLQTGRAVLCDPTGTPPSASLPGEARGAVICAPLIPPAKPGIGAAIGVMQWAARAGASFTQDDLDFLIGSASMAAAALETARVCDELREARQHLLVDYHHLQRHQSELEAENVELRRELQRAFPFETIMGSSPKIREAIALGKKVGDSSVSIFITGESGTGKEMLAKAIHFNSGRALRPFAALNCAAVPEGLLESELFGIEKGVATGVESRPGKLELADGGTLFLDEVADMAPATQAKLLRALQEQEVTRVGGRTPVKVDLRVIAATNKDLQAAMAKGAFREELYYRLNVIEIHLPALRERKEDIPLLARHFLQVFAEEFNKLVRGFERDAEEALAAYPWPGNVRELKNVVQRCAVLADPGGWIGRSLLPPQIAGAAPGGPAGARQGTLDAAVESVERAMIAQALAAHGGNKSKAAAALGISREGLRLKLAKYGIPGA